MSKKKVTVHNVFIIDASGSMMGSKYQAAWEGVNSEIELLKSDKNVNWTQTVVEFNTFNANREHVFMKPINDVQSLEGMGANGGTPLYQSVGGTLEKVVMSMNSGDKALVKIFTDGEENSSSGKYRDPKELNLMIKILEKAGFTIVFEGTKFDVEKAIKDLGVERGNTHVHDNTAGAIYRMSNMRGGATMSYSSSIAAGADTLNNFYSNVDEDEHKVVETTKQ